VYCSQFTTLCLFSLHEQIIVLLGTFAASFFGADTKSSINLNFVNFTFGVDPATTSPFLVAILRFCSTIVVIFPALDTISIFPLIANTLGNNLLSAYGAWSIRQTARWFVRCQAFHDAGFVSAVQEVFSDERYHSLTVNRKRHVLEKSTEVSSVFWKVTASLPPVLVSIFVSDLSFSLQLAGIAGIYVAFIIPALLQLRSTFQLGNGCETTYQGWYSHIQLCIPVLVFAAFSMTLSLWQMCITKR
jgi:hypothetical protein